MRKVVKKELRRMTTENMQKSLEESFKVYQKFLDEKMQGEDLTQENRGVKSRKKRRHKSREDRTVHALRATRGLRNHSSRKGTIANKK